MPVDGEAADEDEEGEGEDDDEAAFEDGGVEEEELDIHHGAEDEEGEAGAVAEEMQGGTFTVSSLGGIGGTGFTPIINAPEVAILGMPRSKMQPVWNGEEFVPRLIQPLCLSYDHRVIDGATGVRFTTYLAKRLADAAGLIGRRRDD